MADENNNTQPTVEELLARISQLEAINNQPVDDLGGISFKIGEKGGVSVMGLQRFPVTLYYDQWMRLLSGKVLDGLLDFLEANKDTLSVKPAIAPRDNSAKTKGVKLSKLEADSLPTLMGKHINNPEFLAKLATIKASHDVNGKVPFEAYVDLVTILGK